MRHALGWFSIVAHLEKERGFSWPRSLLIAFRKLWITPELPIPESPYPQEDLEDPACSSAVREDTPVR